MAESRAYSPIPQFSTTTTTTTTATTSSTPRRRRRSPPPPTTTTTTTTSTAKSRRSVELRRSIELRRSGATFDTAATVARRVVAGGLRKATTSGPAQTPALLAGSARDVDRFEKIGRIGEGTYGIVYKAKDKETGEVVALKRVRMDEDVKGSSGGMSITAIREIKLLKAVSHPNIVKLHDVVVGLGNLSSVFLCFEYVEHDLAGLLETTKPFGPSEVKCLLRQLLLAVEHLHDHYIIHRDIKLSNLLYSNRGLLKVADFGLARQFSLPHGNYTPKVVTLWYRAPELLLGALNYGEAIDMWAVGCVFGELLLHRPLFPGNTVEEQLLRYYTLLGSPSKEIWPGFDKLPNVGKFNLPVQRYNTLSKEFSFLSDAGLDLLKGLLTYCPERRLTAPEALDHEYFKEKPPPTHPEFMPTFPSAHDGIRGKRRPQSRTPPRVLEPEDPLDERIGKVFGGRGVKSGSDGAKRQRVRK